jgi:hypothetical protein
MNVANTHANKCSEHRQEASAHFLVEVCANAVKPLVLGELVPRLVGVAVGVAVGDR